MARGVVPYLVAPLVALGLFGCRLSDYEEREPWRAEAEARCLAEGQVRASAFLEPAGELNGPGMCGMTRPLKVAAMSNGFVAVEPRATLACPLVAELNAWFDEAVQPAALTWFREPVVQIRQISAYSCRSMNGQRGAPISEHAFGNALDIAGFRLKSGREVTVKNGWKGGFDERGFLRHVHAAACERFSTVLGPGADMFHYDHFHVDLARRASGRNVCRPGPQRPTPPMSDGVPVARVPHTSPAATSPWTRDPMHQARGPVVIEREPAPRTERPAGPPLVLSGHAQPPTHSFGAPIAIEDRVLRSLEADPYLSSGSPSVRPVPPGRVPQARTGTDPLVTGSAGDEGPVRAIGGDLFDPDSLVNRKSFGSEGASVFDRRQLPD